MNSASPSASQRKQKLQHFQRTLVLEVAEELFAEQGYAETTMEQIAKQVGFAVGSLYNLFKNKQDLYAALLREKVDNIEPRVKFSIQTAAGPAAKVEAYFRHRIQMFWDYPRFFRMYYRDLAGPFGARNQGLTPEIAARYEDHLKTMESVFADGISRGVFKAIPPRTLTLLSEGIIRSYTASLGHQENPERNSTEEEQIVGLFLDGILIRGNVDANL